MPAPLVRESDSCPQQDGVFSSETVRKVFVEPCIQQHRKLSALTFAASLPADPCGHYSISSAFCAYSP